MRHFIGHALKLIVIYVVVYLLSVFFFGAAACMGCVTILNGVESVLNGENPSRAAHVEAPAQRAPQVVQPMKAAPTARPAASSSNSKVKK